MTTITGRNGAKVTSDLGSNKGYAGAAAAAQVSQSLAQGTATLVPDPPPSRRPARGWSHSD